VAGATLTAAPDANDTDHWFQLVMADGARPLELIQQCAGADLGIPTTTGVVFGECKASLGDPPPAISIKDLADIVLSAGRSLSEYAAANSGVPLRRFVLISNRPLAPSSRALVEWVNSGTHTDLNEPLPNTVVWGSPPHSGDLSAFLDYACSDSTLKSSCQKMLLNLTFTQLDWPQLSQRLRQDLDMYGILQEQEFPQLLDRLVGGLVHTALRQNAATKGLVDWALTNDGSEPIKLIPPQLPVRIRVALESWANQMPERESGISSVGNLDRRETWNAIVTWIGDQPLSAKRVLALVGNGGRGKTHMLSRLYEFLASRFEQITTGALPLLPADIDSLQLSQWEINTAKKWIPKHRYKERLQERLQVSLLSAGYLRPHFILVADLDLHDESLMLSMLMEVLEVARRDDVSIAFTVRQSAWDQVRNIWKRRDDIEYVNVDSLDEDEVSQWLQTQGISWTPAQPALGSHSFRGQIGIGTELTPSVAQGATYDYFASVTHPVVFSVLRTQILSGLPTIQSAFKGDADALAALADAVMEEVTERVASRAHVTQLQAREAIEFAIANETFNFTSFEQSLRSSSQRWRECLTELEAVGLCDRVGQGQRHTLKLAIPILKMRGTALG